MWPLGTYIITTPYHMLIQVIYDTLHLITVYTLEFRVCLITSFTLSSVQHLDMLHLGSDRGNDVHACTVLKGKCSMRLAVHGTENDIIIHVKCS